MSQLLKALHTSALAIIMTASFAQAELSDADKDQIAGKSGLRVFTSDGAFVGVTNGLFFFRDDRMRLFVLNKVGSSFRPISDDLNVTTYTDKVTLNGTDLILDESKQRFRNAIPPKFFRDDDGPRDVVLLSRR
ncbi:MAG: hypothetical protein ABJ263_14105 [Tateyamaria sp.]|uniref:hypothetical protein n=1 Tax=Tateyamaria sp. TaxID=1929288 RepID=UPI00328F9E49